MKLDHRKLKFIILGTFVLAIAGAVMASFVSPVASQDEQASNWVKRCNELKEGEKTAHCEIFQRLIVKESGQRIAEFAIGFPKDKQGARGVMILPLGMLLTEGVKMQVDEGQAFRFDVRYCTANGCFAFLTMGDPVLNMLKKGDTANISFKTLDGKDFSLSMSLKGFSKSLEGIS